MTIYEIKYARATATARRLFAPVSHLPPQSRSQRLRPTINFFDYGTLRATWALAPAILGFPTGTKMVLIV